METLKPQFKQKDSSRDLSSNCGQRGGFCVCGPSQEVFDGTGQRLAMHPERWRGRRDGSGDQTQEGAGCWTVNGPQPDSRQGELPGDKKTFLGEERARASKAATRRSGTPGVARGSERALPAARTFGNCSHPAAPGPGRTRTAPLLLVINRTQTRAGWGPSRVGGA